MFEKIKEWFAVITLIVGIAIGAFSTKLILNNKILELEKSYSELVQKAQDVALQQSAKLADYKSKADKDKLDEIKKITDTHNAIIRSLQQRATRAEQASRSANARPSCTGAELSREDAEFLTREAARADRVIKERDYYYDRYEDARRLLQGENAGQYGEIQNSKPVP